MRYRQGRLNSIWSASGFGLSVGVLLIPSFLMPSLAGAVSEPVGVLAPYPASQSDGSDQTTYVGVEETRPDSVASGLSGSGNACITPYGEDGNDVIYEGADIELANTYEAQMGTGEQCQGQEYWYAGYTNGLGYQPEYIGWQDAGTDTGTHNFNFWQVTCSPSPDWCWHFDVDGTLYQTFKVKQYGLTDDTSIGSTSNSSSPTSTYQVSNMRYIAGIGGSWTNFSDSFDQTTSPACVYPISNTKANFGVNVSSNCT